MLIVERGVEAGRGSETADELNGCHKSVDVLRGIELPCPLALQPIFALSY